MRKITKYWVTFYAQGVFVADTWNVDLKKNTKPEDIEFPDGAYAFCLYEREDVVVDRKTYQGKPKTNGKTYYHPDSKTTTLKQTAGMKNATEILLSNMRINNWKKVIWNRYGNFPQPYDESIIIIERKK